MIMCSKARELVGGRQSAEQKPRCADVSWPGTWKIVEKECHFWCGLFFASEDFGTYVLVCFVGTYKAYFELRKI